MLRTPNVRQASLVAPVDASLQIGPPVAYACRGGECMPGNKCDECGTKINRVKTPYKFKHGSHQHSFCDQY